MRRIIALATLGLALFATAACADVPQDPPGSSPAPSKVTLVDKKTTCAAYNTLSAETETKLTPVVADLKAGQSDPVKALSAFGELRTIISGYQVKLSALTAEAGDPEVKAALDAELTSVKKLQADLDAAGTDPAKVQAVVNGLDKSQAEKVKALCK